MMITSVLLRSCSELRKFPLASFNVPFPFPVFGIVNGHQLGGSSVKSGSCIFALFKLLMIMQNTLHAAVISEGDFTFCVFFLSFYIQYILSHMWIQILRGLGPQVISCLCSSDFSSWNSAVKMGCKRVGMKETHSGCGMGYSSTCFLPALCTFLRTPLHVLTNHNVFICSYSQHHTE